VLPFPNSVATSMVPPWVTSIPRPDWKAAMSKYLPSAFSMLQATCSGVRQNSSFRQQAVRNRCVRRDC
jgi:hypothetical protein